MFFQWCIWNQELMWIWCEERCWNRTRTCWWSPPEESWGIISWLENMWNGNNWEFIRKCLKNPGCFLFSTNCAGQGMLELKTLYLHFAFVGAEIWIISDIFQVWIGTLFWISSLFGLIDSFERFYYWAYHWIDFINKLDWNRR